MIVGNLGILTRVPSVCPHALDAMMNTETKARPGRDMEFSFVIEEHGHYPKDLGVVNFFVDHEPFLTTPNLSARYSIGGNHREKVRFREDP